jgi:hypothetical protein
MSTGYMLKLDCTVVQKVAMPLTAMVQWPARRIGQASVSQQEKLAAVSQARRQVAQGAAGPLVRGQFLRLSARPTLYLAKQTPASAYSG